MGPHEPSVALERPWGSGAGLKRGVAGFVLLTLAGLAALFLLTFPGDVASVIRGLSPGFLVLAVLSTVVDLFLGPLRFHLFLRKLIPGTPFSLPFRADLVGRFLGAVTPSQSGGGPGQIFVLFKGGIPLPVVLSVLMVNLVASLTFLLVAGGAAVWIFQERLDAGAIRHLTQWGALVFGSVLLLLLVSVLRPRLLAGPLERLARALSNRPGRLALMVRRGCEALAASGEQYQASCVDCVRRWPVLPVAAAVLAALLYLNKFTLAWFLMRGLGVEGPYLTTVAVQALLHFILFVAPTPGGSGIAEVSTGALMS
ncbi:MAG TPA: lysylphosphatidylglycerol synthase transmembrane domain-containing protein, partial [Longimicrobiales bacterium]|nr:lysylphosphatidylglycerol synthase transmembrane domain-containing protein [Longimicrobiales bacterium]